MDIHSAIEDWLLNYNISPKTNKPLPNIGLVPNRALKSMIIQLDSSSFVCPITRDLLKTPVILNDGYTYEKDAIDRCMQRLLAG